MLPLTMLMFFLGLCASLPETDDHEEIEPLISDEVTGEHERAERGISDLILARQIAAGGGFGPQFNPYSQPRTNSFLYILLPFILNRLNITALG